MPRVRDPLNERPYGLEEKRATVSEPAAPTIASGVAFAFSVKAVTATGFFSWRGWGAATLVIVVPAEAVEKALNEAERLTSTEVKIRAELDAGATLEQVLAKYGHV